MYLYPSPSPLTMNWSAFFLLADKKKPLPCQSKARPFLAYNGSKCSHVHAVTRQREEPATMVTCTLAPLAIISTDYIPINHIIKHVHIVCNTHETKFIHLRAHTDTYWRYSGAITAASYIKNENSELCDRAMQGKACAWTISVLKINLCTQKKKKKGK